jgi:hypothetical protein
MVRHHDFESNDLTKEETMARNALQRDREYRRKVGDTEHMAVGKYLNSKLEIPNKAQRPRREIPKL